MRTQDFDEFLVSRMRQICVTIGFAAKCDQEPMRETGSLAFGTDIGAHLEIFNGGNLLRQCCERIDNFLNIFFAGLVFELEQDEMPKQLARLRR